MEKERSHIYFHIHTQMKLSTSEEGTLKPKSVVSEESQDINGFSGSSSLISDQSSSSNEWMLMGHNPKLRCSGVVTLSRSVEGPCGTGFLPDQEEARSVPFSLL